MALPLPSRVLSFVVPLGMHHRISMIKTFRLVSELFTFKELEISCLFLNNIKCIETYEIARMETLDPGPKWPELVVHSTMFSDG
jgi:hypothetical protein